MEIEIEAGRIAGCLLGGALGDALGAPVEFLSLGEIRSRFGPAGVTELAPAYGRFGAVTDDTQMTLFTAEGLLRAHNRFLAKGVVSIPDVVWHAYQRWLHTQGETSAGQDRFRAGAARWPDGWLVTVASLHERRAPGGTCLSALLAVEPGSIERPPNDSKGCGAVMRAAPVGLAPLDEVQFDVGAAVGAITHGHPSGYLAAGFLAQLVAGLARGGSCEGALRAARADLAGWDGAGEVQAAVEQAVALAAAGGQSAERVESLGQGWVAEEALAIALYCALVAEDFRHGVALAVNHGGDSDSTGAITGSILGAQLGVEALPEDWLLQLELRGEIEQIAGDLARHHEPPSHRTPYEVDIPDAERYPGW